LRQAVFSRLSPVKNEFPDCLIELRKFVFFTFRGN